MSCKLIGFAFGLAVALAVIHATDRLSRAAEPHDACTPTSANYLHIADEVDANLQRQILSKWFPTAVDQTAGGFYENYKHDWSPGETGEKTLVYQSRLTWLAAQAANIPADRSINYRAITRHGVAVLADKLWDKDQGGFFWEVDNEGQPTRDRGTEKHAYGIAFGIYACAGSHSVTRDESSLELARQAFRWLDDHAHDAKHGGYYEALSRDGTPILEERTGRSDAIGTQYGRKSMNTHIHLLEAFDALYAVWPDELVRSRLEELHEIVATKIYAEPGILHLYTTADWQPVPGIDSFGHDIEAAFLLVEATERLGKHDDDRTWKVARKLVDHALDVGFDHERGGFYYEGTAAGEELQTRKVWWVQAEGLNALLLMHERYGRETPRYWDAFCKQWQFITRHQVDHEHGGWFNTVSAEGHPVPGQAKSNRWTECYHQGRAMLTVSKRLRSMVAAAE
jgi:cellobiose epimerase